MMPRTFTGRQQGLVMVIALIMLLAVTLMVVAAANLVQANLKAVQNMEIREQARSSAVAAIEEAISNGTADFLPRFIASPDDAFLASCDGTTLTCSKVNNVKKYDTNGDGVPDVTVRLSDPDDLVRYPLPRCVSARTKKVAELELSPPDYPEEECLPESGMDITLGGAENSWCAETLWELTAVAEDLVTGAEVVVRQGVSVTMTFNDKSFYCAI